MNGFQLDIKGVLCSLAQSKWLCLGQLKSCRTVKKHRKEKRRQNNWA